MNHAHLRLLYNWHLNKSNFHGQRSQIPMLIYCIGKKKLMNCIYVKNVFF